MEGGTDEGGGSEEGVAKEGHLMVEIDREGPGSESTERAYDEGQTMYGTALTSSAPRAEWREEPWNRT